MREKSDATFEPFLFRWHLFLGLFLSLTWLCVPHVRQTISPSSWLKTVPRQTEHWLAMGERGLVKRTLSFHVVAAVGPATGKKVARPPKLRSFRRGNKNSPSAAMPLARATAPFLAIALALCACVFKGASALESECSACEVVAVRWEKAGEESVGRGHRLFLPLPLEHPLLDLDPSAPLSHRKNTPPPPPPPPPPPLSFPDRQPSPPASPPRDPGPSSTSAAGSARGRGSARGSGSTGAAPRRGSPGSSRACATRGRSTPTTPSGRGRGRRRRRPLASPLSPRTTTKTKTRTRTTREREQGRERLCGSGEERTSPGPGASSA